MGKRLSSKRLLAPTDFSPTADGFEILGVFNPGAARLGADHGNHGDHANEIVLLVRVDTIPIKLIRTTALLLCSMV